FLDTEPARSQLRREPVDGDAAEGEDEEVGLPLDLDLRREDVADANAAGACAGELEMVLDRDAGRVETREVQVPAVLVHALACRDRRQGERDVASRRRAELGAVEARRVASPVGDHYSAPGGHAALEQLPGLHDP